MKTCDWASLRLRRQALENELLAGGKATDPFPVLGLFDSPQLQKKCSEIYTNNKLNLESQTGIVARIPKEEKIKIGYFSMDFCQHPVSYLVAELIESHDRTKFEVYGFSFGIYTNDPMRMRMEKAFDRFFDIQSFSEFDAARLSREQRLDIAVDLGGHTRDARPRIFAERAAPIQINYLGYPGTWGNNCVDYIVGDKVAIPDENRAHFSEKIIYMPNSFQVNPSYRTIAKNNLSKRDLGLPDESFVFCCFNNSWKINPEMFGQWMKILQRVPTSILWLYADNLSASANLKLEATKQGVPADRIIFSKWTPRDEYIAQFKYADLFLDTLPYNAGTTASDALWAGLPVLTLMGRSFAGRMAASLLTSIGIPELITYSRDEYCSVAIELASNPEKLASINTKLAQNRSTTSLFDTKLFANHLETAYKAAYERYHSGQPPDHIHVGT